MNKDHDPHANANDSEHSRVTGWLLSHAGGGYAPYRAVPIHQKEMIHTEENHDD